MARSIFFWLLFATTYFALGAASVALTRFDGGVAFISVATAVLIAILANTPRPQWWQIITAAFTSGSVATGLFGIGWLYAAPMALTGIVEAIVAVVILQRGAADDGPFESRKLVRRFLFAAGIAGPAVSALLGPLLVYLAVGGSWPVNVMHWLISHALGNIIFAPLAKLTASGEIAGWRRRNRFARRMELAFFTALVAGAGWLAFGQDQFPLLFLPVLVAILAAFRFGSVGAASALVMLALVAFTITLTGSGPVDLLPWTMGHKIQFLQFYLAAIVVTVLPIAGDLANRSRLYRSLHESEARYRALADNSTDIIMSVDVDGTILFASQSIRHLGGYEPEEVVGRNAVELIDADHVEIVRGVHRAQLERRHGSTRVEYLGITKSGERRWFEATTRCVLNRRGDPIGVVSVVRDMAERKALEDQLSEAALTDPLTGLNNRRAFDEELERLLNAGTSGCIAIFDIDHFKSVNDRFGHDAGDQVLADFARMARGLVRADDMVGRLGGEEFGILLPRQTAAQAEAVCQRILTTLSGRTTHIGNVVIRVTASAGIAPIEGSAEACMKAADVALYAAKSGGRDQLKIAA